jgi:hypothetical protein
MSSHPLNDVLYKTITCFWSKRNERDLMNGKEEHTKKKKHTHFVEFSTLLFNICEKIGNDLAMI